MQKAIFYSARPDGLRVFALRCLGRGIQSDTNYKLTQEIPGGHSIHPRCPFEKEYLENVPTGHGSRTALKLLLLKGVCL